jgi:acyl-CoA synthetase (NDP forming)
VVLVAVGGQDALATVAQCAEMGVQGCIVMSSGFAETGQPDARRLQIEMVSAARQAGMRLIGPNSQGIANFANGSVLAFSTLFAEREPMDGPVGIVSQSGAMAAVGYELLRRRGLGVRYVHATGNDADIDVAELSNLVVADPEIQLVVLYLEDLRAPVRLQEMAQAARERDLPVVALMGGRSKDGQCAAQSHTGALASEERVVEAFFERCGIWRARSMPELLRATEMYVHGRRPRGRRVAVVSNSGAVCVLAADATADVGMELADFTASTSSALRSFLPPYATTDNPVDLTAALLTDSALLGRVLDVLGTESGVDACLVGIPVAGEGYDVPRFASDVAAYASSGEVPVLVAAAQESVAATFRAKNLPVFADEHSALTALSQLIGHRELMSNASACGPFPPAPAAQAVGVAMSELDGLRLLDKAGIRTVQTVRSSSGTETAAAFRVLGSQPVAIKGCPSVATHKSDLGLVRLGVTSAEEAQDVGSLLLQRMTDLDLAFDGLIVSPMLRPVFEGYVGAHRDPIFGVVVIVGAGGTNVEVAADVRVLLPPFEVADVARALSTLRVARLFRSQDGGDAVDLQPWANAAVMLCELMQEEPQILSVDVNPLMICVDEATMSAVAADAVVVMSTQLEP